MDGWDNFFVAMAGAAVAFAGLVLVSISINLERIIKQPALIGRAAEPLIVLFALFVAASFILIPDQRTHYYGIEILVLGSIFSIVIARIVWRQRGLASQQRSAGLVPRGSYPLRVLLAAVTASSMVLAGIVLTAGNEHGAYLLVPSMIAGFSLSFTEAWVLLVEIDR